MKLPFVVLVVCVILTSALPLGQSMATKHTLMLQILGEESNVGRKVKQAESPSTSSSESIFEGSPVQAPGNLFVSIDF